MDICYNNNDRNPWMMGGDRPPTCPIMEFSDSGIPVGLIDPVIYKPRSGKAGVS